MAVFLFLSASLLLSLMGPDYAREGATPLRLVALGVLPRTFIEAYVAVRRATRNLTEPTLLAGTTSILALVGAAVGAVEYGLVGVAAGWLIAQTIGGCAAALRLSPILLARNRTQPAPLRAETTSP